MVGVELARRVAIIGASHARNNTDTANLNEPCSHPALAVHPIFGVFTKPSRTNHARAQNRNQEKDRRAQLYTEKQSAYSSELTVSSIWRHDSFTSHMLRSGYRWVNLP